MLPSVTLLCIDCVNPGRALLSMEYTMRRVKFGRALLLTNTDRFWPIAMEPKIPGLEIVKHMQTDKKVPVTGRSAVAVDYELDAMRIPATYSGLGHVMFMEWDAAVLNPNAWEKEFLDCDYIGAPWVHHHDPGWPPCNETNSVGNGGFSLQSALFCRKAKEASELFEGDAGMYVHDSWLCRTIRPWMEAQGVKFASIELAEKFSCENRIYCGEFGFHGKTTATMNGWNGNWLGKMRYDT